MAEINTAAMHRFRGGDLEARLRADFAQKVTEGKTMHGVPRSLPRDEITALNVGRQEKQAPVLVVPPPPPVRECAHRPRRDPDGDWCCVGCGEWVDAPAETAPLVAPVVCEPPCTVKRDTEPPAKPKRKPAARPALSPEIGIRLAELNDLLDALRCEPMSVLPRHLAMTVGRPTEAVLHDLGILREFGLAKQAKSGRWRARE